VTVIELEFDTSTAGRAPLGDIASSLVSVDELLRDLASIAADPSSAEYRQIEVAAMTTRNPLRVKLSLLAIPEEAVKAFQAICREIILSREGPRRSVIDAALSGCARQDITAQESKRLYGHVASLQNAEVRLKAVVAREEPQ
jgi:hypothetical protein